MSFSANSLTVSSDVETKLRVTVAVVPEEPSAMTGPLIVNDKFGMSLSVTSTASVPGTKPVAEAMNST